MRMTLVLGVPAILISFLTPIWTDAHSLGIVLTALVVEKTMAEITLTPNTRTWRDRDGYLVLGEIERCETCGRMVQAANAVKILPPYPPEIEVLPRLDNPPPEQFYDDDTGMCQCEECA